jgi:LysR family nitrogen assimilation transcriptional regulator
MDAFQLKAFICVADFSSLSKASLLLRVSQPTISRNIRKLEEETGTTLLLRHGRGVALTDEGARFLPHATAILERMEGATRELQALRKEPEGVVNLGVATAIGTVILPRIARRVRDELPKVSLACLESGSSELFEWLLAGRLDVAIIHEPDSAANVITNEVLEQEIYLVGAAGSLPAPAGTVSLEELSRLPLILSRSQRPPRKTLEDAMDALGITMNCVMQVNTAHLMRALAMAGSGYTVLPLSFVRDDVDCGRLAVARIGDGQFRETVSIVTTTFHPVTAATRVVARVVGDEFRALSAETAVRRTGGR